ncbi:MAG: S8 family peptidase [Elainella sp.]
MSKLDPRLRFLQQQPQETLPRFEVAGRFGLLSTDTLEPRVEVLLQYLGDSANLSRYDFRLETQIGRVIVGSVPFSRLSELEALTDVLRIEAAQPIQPTLDVSLSESRITPLHQATPAIRGAGVVVGVIDSGIDYTHPAFRRTDGTSRILAIWDQNLQPGASEAAPKGPLYNSGVEYVKADIDKALASRNPLALVRHQDRNDQGNHGTHVVGIAAGNGRPSNQYVGVAPEADIIFVATAWTDAAILSGASYIFDKATELNRPVVINMSLGGHSGPHDGTSNFETGLDQLLGRPGRSLVISAGNEGADGIHATGIIRGNSQETLRLNVPQRDSQFNYIELWYSGAAKVSISITPPGGTASPAIPADTSEQQIQLSNGNLAWVANTQNPINLDYQILVIQERGSAQFIQAGAWTVTLRNTSTVEARFHTWVVSSGSSSEDPPTYASAQRQGTVGTPGTSKGAITVGSYVTKLGGSSPTQGQISVFSSTGPTRDGRLKPEISGPGEVIVAPQPNSRYEAKQGTSMSSPHVAGVVALMLQRNRSLTQSQIREVLTRTARKDSATDAVPNQIWGFGKLDAKAAVDAVAPPRLTPVPVYEFHASNSQGQYRFFYSRNANPMAGWVRSGRQFLAFAEQPDSSVVPIYRFSASGPWRFQYSRSITPSSPGWHNDGIAFYAYAGEGQGRRAVYQFSPENPSAQNPWRFRYSAEQRVPDAGWRNDGIAFYIPTA